MKVLALGDPHGKLPKSLDKIIKSNRIEMIICIGEVFPIIRHKNGTGDADIKTGEKVIKKISSFNLPIILFKGNMFNLKGKEIFTSILKKYDLSYEDIGIYKIEEKKFVLFDMIFEPWAYKHLDKDFIKEVSKDNFIKEKKLNDLLKNNREAILLSHSPPFGYVDRISSGEHKGSKILLKAIKRYKPKLVICGHIHEGKGKAKIGETIVYNLGCCGDHKILEL